MKKFFKAASILAAVSMLFAFASCQQDPETPATSGTAPVFKAETKTVDLSSLDVTSITEVKVVDENIATVEYDGTKVTVKSKAKGTTAATVKVAGKKGDKDATGEAALTITVSETGKLEVKGLDSITLIETPESGGNEPGENPGENPGGNEPGENPGGNEPAATGTVWEFETQPDFADPETKKITKIGASFVADSGSTATLTVKEATDLKWAGTDEYYLQAGKNSKLWSEYATKAKAQLTLTTTETATIEILESGSGGAPGENRWIVITNASGEVVGKVESSLTGDQNTCKIEAAPAGEYTIYMNGARIHSIKVIQ